MAPTAAHRVDEQDTTHREPDDARRRTGDGPAQPRAGRTGVLGSRAERPADGTHRTGEPATPPHTGRGGKAPSAAGPKSQEAQRCRKEGVADKDLPDKAGAEVAGAERG